MKITTTQHQKIINYITILWLNLEIKKNIYIFGSYKHNNNNI
jgi:hypothetical protein